MFGGLKSYLVTGLRTERNRMGASEVIAAFNEFEAQSKARASGFVDFKIKQLDPKQEPDWRR